jgi:NAD(P)-dependent dehydrogenase (short-subunit alcohol dehydrogenase family)
MKTLAMELGPAGVRVNAICPGSVDGDRMERVLDMESAATGQDRSAVQAQYTQGVSLRKFMSPQDIAEMAFFLASEVAKNVTGQAISVDGNTERMV